MTRTTTKLAPGRQYGPWAPDLDPAERLARTRSLRAIVRLLTGPRGAELAALLQEAETDPGALVSAADALDALAPLDMRKVLSSYAGLARPPARAGKASGPQLRGRAWVWPRKPAGMPWAWAAVA